MKNSKAVLKRLLERWKKRENSLRENGTATVVIGQEDFLALQDLLNHLETEH